MKDWPSTKGSLLARVRDTADHEAWCRFFDTYGPVLYQYARRGGLQDADAADVMQDVLRRVSRAMPEFEYDQRRGTFRGWLFTVARNSLNNFLSAAAQRQPGSGDSKFQQLLAQLPDELEDSRVWDVEYERHLLMRVAEQVKGTFADTTWQAFWQTAVEGKEVKDVADSLGMSLGAVYVAKCRVLARIRREVENIEGTGSG